MSQVVERIFSLSETYIKGLMKEIAAETETRTKERHKAIEEAGPRPEWIRIRTAVKLFDLSESYIKGLISENKIKSRVLKDRGQIRGVRLISFDSLNEFIEGGKL
ncbi:MAG TPA: hypothetical protein VNQ90_17805 [Chthoniobacteraceae bacterium]|nr:hypothetical protein [Chthoniobacteraceae bacterium]